MHELGQTLQRMQRAGRSFTKCDRHHFEWLGGERVPDLIQSEHFTPRTVEAIDLGAIPGRHCAQPLAEVSIDSDQHPIARFNEVA